MDQQEGLDQATCDAETGEPCVLMVSCDLPKGHEGDHHAVVEWAQEEIPRQREGFFTPTAWVQGLMTAHVNSLLRLRDNGPTTPDAPTED
jgi:hypothetical protein